MKDPAKYGKCYFCVIVPKNVAADGQIYFCADEVYSEGGALTATRMKNGAVEKTLILAPGQ